MVGKTRSKNFSEEESKVLLSACDKFHSVINKNSNRDVDKIAKVKAWEKIKQGFDNYCRAEGIYVSKNLMCLVLVNIVQSHQFICMKCILLFQIENRTIEQLQTKYKSLKKQARTVLATVKKDIAQTGNKPLQRTTTQILQGKSSLLSLRSRMGASAAGFTSKHCMYLKILYVYFIILKIQFEIHMF